LNIPTIDPKRLWRKYYLDTIGRNDDQIEALFSCSIKELAKACLASYGGASGKSGI
jgi:hypothetical protein